MDRNRGYWWAPDGSAILTARVDETPVQFWHIADPANPAAEPRAVRYPAAGTPNAVVSVFVATLAGDLTEVSWDSAALPYLVTASWDGRHRPAAAGRGQPRPAGHAHPRGRPGHRGDQPGAGRHRPVLGRHRDRCAGGLPDGRIVWTADIGGAKRLVAGTAAEHAAGTAADPHARLDQCPGGAWHRWRHDPVHRLRPRTRRRSPSGPPAGGRRPAEPGATACTAASRRPARCCWSAARWPTPPLRSGCCGPAQRRTARPRSPRIGSLAETPDLPAPAAAADLVGGTEPDQDRDHAAVLAHAGLGQAAGPVRPVRRPARPAGDGRRRGTTSARSGSPSRASPSSSPTAAELRAAGPEWDRAVAGDLAGPVLGDQVEALYSAAEQCPDLDLTKVGIRGWSFGGYLAALAVLRRPDVFHAGIAGAPPTDWRLYDTCYTERYLGLPDAEPGEPTRRAPCSPTRRSCPGRCC